MDEEAAVEATIPVVNIDSGRSSYCIRSEEPASEYHNLDSERKIRRVAAAKKRNITPCCYGKDKRRNMIEAIESTFQKLDQRTAHMEDTARYVSEKQTKVQSEIKDNLSYITEMKARVKALLEKQSRIARNYANVDKLLDNRHSELPTREYTKIETPKFKPQRERIDYSSDEYSRDSPSNVSVSEDYLVDEDRKTADQTDKHTNEESERVNGAVYDAAGSDDEEIQNNTVVLQNGSFRGEHDESSLNINEVNCNSVDEDVNFKEQSNHEEDQIHYEEEQNYHEEDSMETEEDILEAQRVAAERLKNELLEEERLMREKEEKSEEDEAYEEELARARAMEEIRKLEEES